ncbi:hypothetical protein BDA99DRAFT_519655 [Phascolomyces articulosus]|uniref:ER transporter 6TM N-terminal domain-containing protein n=1 Tax=Phascolomyces articulosus TaxID=60185 RepID=A0AAD5JTR1_9FUNG|nr:hypothetical protein BDA99DRAFT_519655 [Phascolomyces articulosus]
MNKTSSESSPLHNNDNAPSIPSTAAPTAPVLPKWKTFLTKLHLPPLENCRKPLKTSLAFLIGIIMTLSNKCREAIGPGSLLICIVLVFYSPSRPLGVVFEDVIFGSLGAIVASAYSLLAMYCASIARDLSDPSPVQPESGGVLAIFLLVAVFLFSVLRLRVPKSTFACINGCIVVAFSLTQSSVVHGFEPSIVWSFMIPIAVGGIIALGISALIWPDDSITNYMNILHKALDGYNVFFKEHAEGLLSITPTDITTTLPTLHDRVQSTILSLIDSKRSVHRDILFSRLNGHDISKITKLVKAMRTPLHGIGVSQIMKQDFMRYSAQSLGDNELHNETIQKQIEQENQDLIKELEALKPYFQQLIDGLHDAMEDCITRLLMLHPIPERDNLHSFLWPFPRLWYTHRPNKHRHHFNNKHRPIDIPLHHIQPDQVEEMVHECIRQVDAKMTDMLTTHWHAPLRRYFSGLHLISLYRFCVREYAMTIIELLKFVGETEKLRKGRRLWFPSNKSIRKWFRDTEAPWSSSVAHSNVNGGGQNEGHDDPVSDLTLVRTHTRHEVSGGDYGAHQEEIHRGAAGGAFVLSSTGKRYHRDPDVDAPASRIQKFWYILFRVHRWIRHPNTTFAMKTAIGTVLLAVPVYLENTAEWFIEWRFQWCMIIMMLWMLPSTGMFLYSLLMKTLGTIAGGVLGIVVWEITQGNPYGIGGVLFVVLAILYYQLMYRPTLRMFCVLTIITLLLVVIYEYQYKVGGMAGHDEVWTVAGKRIALVLVGVIAASILSMIPEPHMGRVELRKRLAQTLRDIGRMYGILTSQFIVEYDKSNKRPTKEQLKGFSRLAINIRRQLADERVFLNHARFEPPLRGRFPIEVYQIVLEKVDNIADLVMDMSFALKDIDPVWRKRISTTLNKERRRYLASNMTTIKLLSATLAAKMALPPYMISPGEARQQFSQSLNNKVRRLQPEDLTHPSFLRYSTYVVTSGTFVQELQTLLEAVEDLVGVEDPQEWLRLHV